MKAKLSQKAMLAARAENEVDETKTPFGNDGYWLHLKDGWSLDGCSSIHEGTRAACIARLKECVYKNPIAKQLGKLSKGKTSPAKKSSSKANGAKGGRPVTRYRYLTEKQTIKSTTKSATD